MNFFLFRYVRCVYCNCTTEANYLEANEVNKKKWKLWKPKAKWKWMKRVRQCRLNGRFYVRQCIPCYTTKFTHAPIHSLSFSHAHLSAHFQTLCVCHGNHVTVETCTKKSRPHHFFDRLRVIPLHFHSTFSDFFCVHIK